MSETDLRSNILRAVERRDLSSNRPIINLLDFGPILHIKLPETLSIGEYSIIDISCIDNPNDIESLPTDDIVGILKYLWIDIHVDRLATAVGIHTYRIMFVDIEDPSNTIYMYFSYIIQDDNPAKSYIYMNRE